MSNRRMVCRDCGSEDVDARALARFNPTTGQWDLSSVDDGDATCGGCGNASTRMVWRESQRTADVSATHHAALCAAGIVFPEVTA